MKKLREEKGMMEIGAILVLVLIMSVGISVYNTAYVKTTNIGSSAIAIEMQTFNSQFTPYSGTGLTGTQIRSLMAAIISSNATNDKHQISVVTSTSTGLSANALFTNGTSESSDLSKISQGLSAGRKYTVELNYDMDGFIEKIEIK